VIKILSAFNDKKFVSPRVAMGKKKSGKTIIKIIKVREKSANFASSQENSLFYL